MTNRYRTKPLPMEHLADHYQCDFDSGVLYRKVKGGLVAVGTKMARQGGLKCKVKQQMCTVHRIMYAMYHSIDPMSYVIDHKDGDRFNNRISNLRAVSQRVNCYNRKVPCGVRRNHDTWQAYISLQGRFYCLGNYRTKEDAEARRKEFNQDFMQTLLEEKEHSLSKLLELQVSE